MLEALSDLIRRAEREAGAVKLASADLQAIGLEPGSAARLLKALGYTRARQAKDGEPGFWRHRTPKPARATSMAEPAQTAGDAGAGAAGSGPFAALAALQAPATRPKRRRARVRRAAAPA